MLASYLTPKLHSLLIVFLALCLYTDAHAQHVRVQTSTNARATQQLRSDLSVSAPRTLAQSITLSAFDLRGDRTGSLNLRVQFRYFHDFGFRAPSGPFEDSRLNQPALDLAYLTFRPHRQLTLTAGRQWLFDPLGFRDFDGLRVAWNSSPSGEVRGRLSAFAGRDVLWQSTLLDPDTFDVQGIPDTWLVDQGPSFLGGASAGFGWSLADFHLSWQRRQRLFQEEGGLLDERIGAAMSANPMRRLNVGAHGSYHTILGQPDRAGADLAWMVPPTQRTFISVGISHRIPTFDADSIFNLFGARPHRGGWLTVQQEVAPLATMFEVSGFGRLYYGNDFAGLVDEEGAQGYGGALAHHSRIRVFEHPIRWRSQASIQEFRSESQGRQIVADTGVRTPIVSDFLFLRTRALYLHALPSSHRAVETWALTAVLGLEAKLSMGRLLVFGDYTSVSTRRDHGGGWISLEVDAWP